MLIQRDDKNKPLLISCSGYSLNTHQKNYSIIEIEMLALVYAVREHASLLLANKFTVYSDNIGCTYVQSLKHCKNSHLFRYSILLQTFNF